MSEATPLKFDFDDATPSAVSEFTVSDVTPVINGGTGVSSLVNFGTSLSATTILAASVSATTVSSTAFTGGTFTGASVSATALSATTITGPASMPIPAPYAYAYITTAGTPQDSEQNIGIGSTVASTENSTDDFDWDDTNKRWDVKKTGTYEITANVILTVAATTIVTLSLYVTYPGAVPAPYFADTRIHSSIDPTATTISFIGQIAGGAYAYGVTKDDGSTDVTVQPGTTITVKRLL